MVSRPGWSRAVSSPWSAAEFAEVFKVVAGGGLVRVADGEGAREFVAGHEQVG